MSWNPTGRHRCTIVPPYLLEAIAAGADERLAGCARATLDTDAAIRAARAAGAAAAPPADDGTSPQRRISDAGGIQTLPGKAVREEGAPATGDAATDEAYAGLGATWTFYSNAYARDSLDDEGLPLLASVHYGKDYDNAFWDGTQMVFGDGDGQVFNRFTIALDVIGHELTHGVTEVSAGLTYQGQSGALNESISDVFGSLVKQHDLAQSAEEADWLIGAGLFTPSVKGVALRSMKAPGTAYDDPQLGKDPQPATMSGYVETTDDNGGVHLNSGIPNHAFYLAAVAIGGNAWETTGRIWYDVLTGPDIEPGCDFATFAGLTVTAARTRLGDVAARQVATAWEQVGVTGGMTTPAPTPPAPPAPTVRLRRSGGFAGLRREREVNLDDLPADLARAWSTLLDADGVDLLAEQARQARVVPDAFTYHLELPGSPGRTVALPEQSLPEPVLGLFQRTFEV